MPEKKRLNQRVEFYFCSQAHLSDSQIAIIKKRSGAIAKMAEHNAGFLTTPKTREEMERFQNELPDLIAHVNSPISFPRYKGNSPEAAAIIEFIFTNEPNALNHLRETNLSQTLFQNKQALLQEFREYIRYVIDTVAPQLTKLVQADEIFWAKAFIGHLLVYIPFLDPPADDLWRIPLFVNQNWELIDYKIQKIALTPKWMGSPSVAYGLFPQGKFPPILLFKGTSYPTDEGFGLQLLTDINPGSSVGQYVFRLGTGQLKRWLQKAFQQTETKAKVYGISLGGALTEHAVLTFPEWIDEAFAYNPPALLKHEVSRWNQWQKKGDPLPRVYILKNEQDLVPYVGRTLGKGWEVFQVVAESKPAILTSHFQNFLAHREHLILKEKQPEDRSFLQYLFSWLHVLLSFPLFVFGTLIYMIHMTWARIRK